MEPILALYDRGGAIMLVIAALSVLTLTVIIWKSWHLLRLGAWRGQAAERAVADLRDGRRGDAVPAPGLRYRVVRAAIDSASLGEAVQREETERVARRALAEARRGLRLLDVVATIAPLLGLLGTVLGMIAAFQSLQASGAAADPSVLAGGIWTALLTTAAGMGVAIPAAVALATFESVVDRVAEDMEDLATRVFLAGDVAARRGAA